MNSHFMLTKTVGPSLENIEGVTITMGLKMLI